MYAGDISDQWAGSAHRRLGHPKKESNRIAVSRVDVPNQGALTTRSPSGSIRLPYFFPSRPRERISCWFDLR